MITNLKGTCFNSSFALEKEARMDDVFSSIKSATEAIDVAGASIRAANTNSIIKNALGKLTCPFSW